jgi:cytoskeletal protein CcmA (bactofilin family)
MPIYKIKAARVNNVEAQNYVGEDNSIFYDPDTGALRLSDGATPGGVAITAGGNVSGNGAGTSITIQEQGTVEGNVTAINFQQGAAVTIANGVATVNITAGAGSTVDGNISAQQILELISNRHNNTFVGNVDFTASPTVVGAGDTVTLTISARENPNAYDINWGDGTTTIGTTSASPTHVYSNIAQQPFSVNVRAYNTGGIGYGSSAFLLRPNLITAFAASPTTAFSLFRAATAGTALTGNLLYAVEGEAIYLDNDSTNTANANVTYTILWGDNNTTVVSSDSADGGVSGARAAHTYGTGSSTGTGTATVTLRMDTHSTANPALLPIQSNLQLKVYNPGISAPGGLAGRAIAFSTNTGTNPALVDGATVNSNANIAAGTAVSRTIATSGVVTSTATVNYAYNASTGNLRSILNGNVTSTLQLTVADNTGTAGNIVVLAESDYNLLDANGAATTFANSIYQPELFRGLRTSIAQAATGIPVGLNQFYISHDTTGNTQAVNFVKDDLTVAPTVAGGVLSQQTGGTYRYISGVPYYYTGNPSLLLTGVTIANISGQTYNNTTEFFRVFSGNLGENTTGGVVAPQTHTYANVNNSSNPMLTNGIVRADIGRNNAYGIANISIPVNTANNSVGTIAIAAQNVNGTSATRYLAANVQVYGGSILGINEQSIAISGIGNNVYTDAGRRIFNFSAADTNTPVMSTTTNYFTTAPYTTAQDPGVAGTQEATIRWGIIEHNVVDYTAYLPQGPDRSGDTGTQYFTMAFRRQVVSNFSISITSGPTGIAGLWIAAPGTQINTTSTLNGWLDCAATYAGSGVPGANTAGGGNGSNGCAATAGDRVIPGNQLSGSFNMTLGSENMTNATGNVVLVRIALNAGQRVTALSIGA